MPFSQGQNGTITRRALRNLLSGAGLKPASPTAKATSGRGKAANADLLLRPARHHPAPPGIDHTGSTVRHNGIDWRLTDVHGQVLREILA